MFEDRLDYFRLLKRPLLLFVLALNFSASPSMAGTCIKDAREFKIADGTVLKLRDYLCESQGGTRIQVQFHRLNDRTFSGIVGNKLPTILSSIFGQSRLVENEISLEWQRLLSRFGDEEFVGDRTLSLSVDAAGDRSGSSEVPAGESLPVRMLLPEQRAQPSDDFPPDAAIISPLTHARKPENFNRVKRDQDEIYWRYLTYRDLENYGAALAAWNRAITKITGVN